MPTEIAMLQQQSILLKKELKDWEKTFADSHNGCKPKREDIKAATAIGMRTSPTSLMQMN
jgi:hypothetical protein